MQKLLTLLAISSMLIAAGTSTVRADAPLPTDPALVTSTLPNGVKYIFRKHANPPGRVAVWMHVSSGSLNETDKQRGIAHYLEHMAFNGSANFAPGTVVDFFQSLGLSFGRHQNAFTSFDQTTYQLALGDNKPENLDKALMFFSDVAFRLLLVPDEIEKERQIIMEEKRSRMSAQQRMQEEVLKRLIPGSLIGERLPIGTEETINGVQRPDFEAYWKDFYAPDNITVIVVGDIDEATVKAGIDKHFGAEAARKAKADADARVKPFEKDGAIIVTDPEQINAEVSFLRVEKARPPVVTESALRADLVELIGSWAVNRRLATNLETGKASFINANVSTQSLFRSAWLAQGSVTAKPEKWEQAFKDVAIEVRRAQLHGITEQEVADARTELLSQAETAATRESTLPAQALLGSYNNQVAESEPIMSAAQRLDLMKRLLPTITAKEVSENFAANFDTKAMKFVAELPSGDNKLTEEALIAFGREALSVKPEPMATAKRVEKLLSSEPTPGKATDVVSHEASGVTSAWLPSGARVHHKFMDIRKDVVSITVSLAAGSIEETAANRGISEASALAWQQAAAEGMSSTQLREFMTGKKVSVGGGASADTYSISISGSPSELETGLQMAYLLLTKPVIEAAALDRWKVNQLQGIKQRATNVQGVLGEILPDSIFPKGDPRQRPLTEAQVNAITLEAAQARLNSVIKNAPMEISVVGDIKADVAMPMVEKYFGSLAKRDRISATTLDNLRTITREPGPRMVEKAIETKTPLAIVLSGFFNTDADNVTDNRLMQLASRVLSTRMNKVIREEKQLVYSIGAQSQPGSTYPGQGVFFAAAPTEPAKTKALAETIAMMYADFSKSGPTAEELDVAKKQIYNTLDEQMKEAGFWGGIMGTMVYRDRKLDDVMGAKAAYETYTPAQVLATFNKYYTPANSMTFIVTPKDAPAPAAGNSEGK